MTAIHDDDIDALLRQSFDGPTPDAGFSDRVMQRVPIRRRPAAWPLVSCVLAGTVLCWLSLFDSSLVRAAWHGWRAGQWSSSTGVLLAATALLALLALGWSIAEADDH